MKLREAERKYSAYIKREKELNIREEQLDKREEQLNIREVLLNERETHPNGSMLDDDQSEYQASSSSSTFSVPACRPEDEVDDYPHVA